MLFVPFVISKNKKIAKNRERRNLRERGRKTCAKSRKIAGVAFSLKSGLNRPLAIFFAKFSGPRWVGCAGVAGKQSKAKGKPKP